MTVSEMRKLLKGLPGTMNIVTPLDDETFVTVCAENSSVIEWEDEETGEVEEILLLVGCSCKDECDIQIDGINSHPELN